MDLNSVGAWWIDGLRGVVNGLKRFTEEGMQVTEDHEKRLEEYIRKLSESLAALQKNRLG